MLSRRLLRLKVVKSLYAHIKSESDNLQASEKSLVLSIDKTYELYIQMLGLIVDVARYAEERQEIARQKKLPTYEDLNPNRKFVENVVIARIAESEAVQSFLSKHSLGWAKYPELIKNIYNNLTQTPFYNKYMLAASRSFKEDALLVTDFYVNCLEDNEALEEALEEQSIYWSDDLGFALTMVVRTLSNMRESHQELRLQPKFKSEEDLLFAKELFAKSALQFAQNQLYLDRFTHNWDVERLAFMDKLIMSVAMTELVTFASIPVKVTLDEYIELSKYYSSPTSSTFINGVLDKVVESLTEEGRINKSGRGLL
ncbi:MAG: transcription antitermination protein NusB [Rikenellaceae bacterium]|nr:transcription antitermination protein NusB [Rikenellaceae bacterium]MBQ7341984.1 transcription antitermination protein NusB [Alistipes sp.]